MYYETKIELNNIKWCDKHTRIPLLNDICSICTKKEEKIKNKILCKGTTIKNTPCNFAPLEKDDYCKLHQSYKKWKELKDSGKSICCNWIRGCWKENIDNFVKCLECREIDRVKDKTNRNEKKDISIDFNIKNVNHKMCKDCNKVVIQLFDSCCHQCYINKRVSRNKRNPRDKFLVRLYDCKKGAKNRNYNWNLTDEYAINLMKNQCYYCFDTNNIVGIDRIDNTKGYEVDNCVSCCFQCNSMKSTKTKDDFLKICEHISTIQGLYEGKINYALFNKASKSSFNNYKKNAIKRNIIFNLEKSDFDKLITSKCFYCKIEEANGIDRINSNKSYTNINCVSSCYTCNLMKLDYSQDQFIEKCLAITFKKEGIYYKSENINIEKDKLIKMFKNIKFVTETDNNDFIYKKNQTFYDEMIWNGNLDDLKNIKPEIIFVNNEELLDIWTYYRNTVSSVPFQKATKLVGRVIQILVKDSISKKYLGIISLNSDLINLEDRDDYIKWTYSNRILNKKINYLMNLSTCVPLQPFGFNFNGGKLLAKLAFSKEVLDYYYKKFNEKLLGITTTGFHGKSVQYSRLKEFKFVGYTKGFSTYKIPTEIVEQSRKYLMSKGINYSKKIFILTKTIQDLGLNRNDYLLDNPKGVYFGFCHPQAQDFLCEKINILNDVEYKSTNDIFNDWLNKWAEKRYKHLIETNRLNIITKKSLVIHNILLDSNKKNIIIKEVQSHELLKIKEEHIKKYYSKINSTLSPIFSTDKPTYPKHITVYEEKGSMYIQYNKQTKDTRYNKKHKITSNDIQKEVDKLVKDVNEKYTGYELCSEKQTVINPHLFKLKDEPNIEISKDIPKPNLPTNFSICNITGIDYFQYCKKENGQKVQKQKRISSYNIQDEFNAFIKLINEDFNLKFNNQTIENPQNWKTTNKILNKEPSEEKEKNISRQTKYLEKKKAELGEEAFHALKAKQARDRREKKKQEIDL